MAEVLKKPFHGGPGRELKGTAVVLACLVSLSSELTAARFDELAVPELVDVEEQGDRIRCPIAIGRIYR